MPRPTQPRWADETCEIDLNVIASGKRLDVLPPEYVMPFGGDTDKRWRTQEVRAEMKRAEYRAANW